MVTPTPNIWSNMSDHSPAVTAAGAILNALLQQPLTRNDMMDASGMSRAFVEKLVRDWRKQKVLYRSGWAPNGLGYDTVEVFTFGRGRDAPRRPVYSNSEHSLRWQRRRAAREAQRAIELALHGRLCLSTKSPETSS